MFCLTVSVGVWWVVQGARAGGEMSQPEWTVWSAVSRAGEVSTAGLKGRPGQFHTSQQSQSLSSDQWCGPDHRARWATQLLLKLIEEKVCNQHILQNDWNTPAAGLGLVLLCCFLHELHIYSSLNTTIVVKPIGYNSGCVRSQYKTKQQFILKLF